ncbi:serine/threonine protein kinase [Cod iridovirus]|uniref:Serine/threonine protein kinase n=1 Tax=Cod iridovirus TaxID=1887316 RepID=A0A1B2IU69_FRG3V|nr:serine/threonine protein kinase [Cod iridovirus]
MATNYCDEFERDPTRNPRTGRTIKRGGPVFRALERECSDDAARVFPAAAVRGAAAAMAASPRVAAASPCPEFARDPTRNPRTGRTIKRGGPVFRALERECADYGGASPRRVSPARAFPNRRASPARRQSPAEASPCPEFARDPTRNPRTGRTIKRGGPTYRALEAECADYRRLSPIRSPSPFRSPARKSPARKSLAEYLVSDSESEVDYDARNVIRSQVGPGGVCERFAADPTRNPVTGSPLSRNDPLYTDLMEICGGYPDTPLTKSLTGEGTDDDTCEAFCRDPTRNPVTGQKMCRNGIEYQMFAEECDCSGTSRPSGPSRPPNSFEASGAARVPGTPSVSRGEPRWMSSISTRHDYDESNPMSVAFRLRHVKDIRTFLRTVKPGRSGFCATDKGGWLGSAAVSDKVIGQGNWGSVHMVKFRDFPKEFVVKEAVLMSVSEKRRYKPTVVWDEWAAGSVPDEVAINNMVTEIAATGMTPFVPLTAGAGACDYCTPQLLEKAAKVTKCYLQAMEAADFSLDRVLPTMSPDQAASALAQILLGLQSLQTTLGIMHNDIKAHNILVKRVPPGGYWKVTDSFNGQVFYVPNEGYLCMLADYGVVRLVKPAVGMDTLYGTRNARFVPRDVGRWGKGAGTEYVVTPIRSKISVVVMGCRFMGVEPNKTVRYWRNTDTCKVRGVTATNNVFYKGYDIEPDIQVQLDDTNSFPVWESRGDVVDCVRTFVGGKRASQAGFHGLFYKKTGSAWEKAAETMAEQKPMFSGFTLDGSGLKYIRAATACAYIFPGMSVPRPGEREIESFTM